MCGCVRPMPRCEWCESVLCADDAGRLFRCGDRGSGDAAPRELSRRRWCVGCTCTTSTARPKRGRQPRTADSARSTDGSADSRKRGDEQALLRRRWRETGSRRIQADGARGSKQTGHAVNERERQQANNPRHQTRHDPPGVALLCSDCRKRNTSLRKPVEISSRLAASLAEKHGWAGQPRAGQSQRARLGSRLQAEQLEGLPYWDACHTATACLAAIAIRCSRHCRSLRRW